MLATLQDVCSDGRILITRDTARIGMVSLPPHETQERDLSWLDGSSVRDISLNSLYLIDGNLLEFLFI